MPFLWAYFPVNRIARAGQQTGVLAKVFRNRMPSAANRSMCGVLHIRIAHAAESLGPKLIRDDEQDVRALALFFRKDA